MNNVHPDAIQVVWVRFLEEEEVGGAMGGAGAPESGARGTVQEYRFVPQQCLWYFCQLAVSLNQLPEPIAFILRFFEWGTLDNRTDLAKGCKRRELSTGSSGISSTSGESSAE